MINENMFCPKCGKADQKIETYCRQCGTFLPDFEKSKKPITPEAHLTANSVLSLMTAVVSLSLGIVLFSIFLPKEGTPVIIYVTAGFLLAMCAWQVQTFIRTLMLKKHFKRPQPQSVKPEIEAAETTPLDENPVPTNKLLNEADLSRAVPSSVVENTTKNLQKVPRK